VRSVTVHLIGAVVPGLPRQMVVEVDDRATVRELLDEVARRGGDGVRRSIWAEGGQLERTVLVAVDGEACDADALDAPLALSGGTREVALFLIRPIFGGAGTPPTLARRSIGTARTVRSPSSGTRSR
jgi:hypothetical protein